MHSEDQRPNDLIYGLDDRPRPLPAFLAALQHVLASFVGIVTPPLVIGSLLGLGEHLGPVKDVLLAGTYEFGEGDTEAYLLGPGFDLAIPGFD